MTMYKVYSMKGMESCENSRKAFEAELMEQMEQTGNGETRVFADSELAWAYYSSIDIALHATLNGDIYIFDGKLIESAEGKKENADCGFEVFVEEDPYIIDIDLSFEMYEDTSKTIEELESESGMSLAEAVEEYVDSCHRTGHHDIEENARYFVRENDLRESEYVRVLTAVEKARWN